MARQFSPRVLQIVSSIGTGHGGTAASVVGLSYALQSLGADVTIFATNAATPGRSRSHRFGLDASELPRNAEELNVRMFPVRHPYRWLYAPELSKSLEEEIRQFDLVHIHGLYSYPQFAAWRALSRSEIPYVVSTRGNLDPYLRKHGRPQKIAANAIWVRGMLDHAAAIHCTTEEERTLISDVVRLSQKVVIPNGLNVGDFALPSDPKSFRERYIAGATGPIIMNHGRLSFKKGLDILIDALQIVRQEYPDVILAIVGPDFEGLRAKLVQQAEAIGVESAVIFTGELNGQELCNALGAADIWALPSHTENFGLAVAEAMAAGRPVVASNAVNIAPTAFAEGALKMVNVDAIATADAIKTLLSDEEERLTLSERGRQFALRYDWPAVGRQYLDLYQEITGPQVAS